MPKLCFCCRFTASNDRAKIGATNRSNLHHPIDIWTNDSAYIKANIPELQVYGIHTYWKLKNLPYKEIICIHATRINKRGVQYLTPNLREI